MFYLVLRNISQKWSISISEWKAVLTGFTIKSRSIQSSTTVAVDIELENE